MIERKNVRVALGIIGITISSLFALWIAPTPLRLGIGTPHQDRSSAHEHTPTKILLPRCTGVIAHLEGANTLRGEIHVWDYGIKHGCRVAFWRAALTCQIAKIAGADEIAAPAAVIDGQVVLPEAKQNDVYLFTCQLQEGPS